MSFDNTSLQIDKKSYNIDAICNLLYAFNKIERFKHNFLLLDFVIDFKSHLYWQLEFY